jgi:hypothetical protein
MRLSFFFVLLLLTSTAFAQVWRIQVGPELGLALPNGALQSRNLVEQGLAVGCRGELAYALGKISIGFQTGWSRQDFHKDRQLISPDCLNPPYPTYHNAQDTVHGRGLRLHSIPIVFKAETRLLQHLHLGVIAGGMLVLPSLMELTTRANCAAKDQPWGRFVAGAGVSARKVLPMAGLEARVSVSLGTSFQLQIQPFAQFSLQPWLAIEGSGSSFRLFSHQSGVRLSLAYISPAKE